MRFEIIAIGRLKDGPDRKMFQNYTGRLEAIGRPLALGPVQLLELRESRARTEAARKDDEASRIQEAASNKEFLIALDEGGKTFSSKAFADFVGRTRDEGIRSMVFAIGGPDGHGDKLLRGARMRLSLGFMTLPHGLARIVLAEQLYRAATLIAGHPYHRG